MLCMVVQATYVEAPLENIVAQKWCTWKCQYGQSSYKW